MQDRINIEARKHREYVMALNSLCLRASVFITPYDMRRYIGTIVNPHLYSRLAGIRYCGSGLEPQLS